MLRFSANRLAILLVGTAALATAAPAWAEQKLGFVDTQRAIAESARGKTARAELVALAKRRETELEADRKKIEDLQKQFQADRFLLSYEALQQQRLELARLRRQYERSTAELEDDLEFEQAKRLQPIQLKLARVLKQIGEQKKLSMIVDRSSNGLLYFDQTRDLTALAIQKLDSDS